VYNRYAERNDDCSYATGTNNLESLIEDNSGSQLPMKSRLDGRLGAAWQITLVLFLSFILLGAPPVIWLCGWGENFFSLTRPIAADILIVEGWIGTDGIRAAATEFKRGTYRYIVTTGGTPAESDRPGHQSYAELARQELIQSGITPERIIAASMGKIEHERTFNSAVVSWQALQHSGVHPEAINVFSLGPHARRSQLVYQKVYAPDVPVGIIAFVPTWYGGKPWWLSSERRKCLLKETVGYPFELLLNSGRVSTLQ
jgi:DUF218 domain